MSLLDIFRKPSSSQEEILNKGLHFAMEFGKNWLQPINGRLKKAFGQLTDEELSEYNNVCQQVMRYGNEFIYKTLETTEEAGETISEDQLEIQFNQEVSAQFIWVGKTNLKKLFSQSCYYAWRDGLDKVIKN